MINSVSKESLFLEDNLSLMTVSVSDSRSSGVSEIREKTKIIIDVDRSRGFFRVFLIIGIIFIIGICVGLLLLNWSNVF